MTHEGISRLYLFSAKNPEAIRSYTYLDQTGPHEHQWPRATSEPTVFVKEGNRIYQINAQTESLVGVAESAAWHVDENGTLWKTLADERSIVRADNPENIIHQTAEPVQHIRVVQHNDIIIETAGGIKIFKRNGDTIEETIPLPTHQLRYNHSTGEWLSWSPWEIWSIYTDGSVALLNRTSEQVANVRPLDQYGVLLLIRDHSLTAFNPGYFVRQILLQDTDRTPVAVDVTERAMYLFGPGEQTIERITY